jgi:Fe-S-cluster containining protein
MYSMFSDLLIKGRYYYLTLRRFRDGACIFAEKKEGARLKCSIYENRPLACRLYPLKLTVDGRVAKRGKINCPAVFDKKKVNEEVKRLQEMIQHEIQSFEKKAYAWNRSGGGTLEECLKGLC